MLVYDNNLDNQHQSTQKFARQWFGPYVVMSANDNAMYHLGEVDGTRIVVPGAGKQIKAFKKRHESEPERALARATRRMKYRPVTDRRRMHKE